MCSQLRNGLGTHLYDETLFGNESTIGLDCNIDSKQGFPDKRDMVPSPDIG